MKCKDCEKEIAYSINNRCKDCHEIYMNKPKPRKRKNKTLNLIIFTGMSLGLILIAFYIIINGLTI